VGNIGQRPLSLAAQNRHEGVVRIPLGSVEVNLDKRESDGRTPLSYATVRG